MTEHLIPTAVVGSYPQPDWLVDRELLATTVPRVRMPAIWRIPGEHLQEAQDAATLAALSDMTRAGIDVITDGEIRRESYSNHFVTTLGGVDCDTPATIVNRRGNAVEVPRVVGPISRTANVGRRDAEFLRRHAEGTIKVTVPGPFTLAQQAKDEHYGDPEALAMAFAEAVNEELRDLEAAGADIVQLDEPWLRNDPERRERASASRSSTVHWRACRRRLRFTCASAMPRSCATGSRTRTRSSPGSPTAASIRSRSRRHNPPSISASSAISPARRSCSGSSTSTRSASRRRTRWPGRIRRGLRYVAAERLVAAPDCGMKYLPRDRAYGKLEALARGAAIVRGEL